MLVLILARNLHVLLLQPRHTHARAHTRAIFPIHVQNQIAKEGKFEIVRKHVSQTKLFNRLKVPLNDVSKQGYTVYLCIALLIFGTLNSRYLPLASLFKCETRTLG